MAGGIRDIHKMKAIESATQTATYLVFQTKEGVLEHGGVKLPSILCRFWRNRTWDPNFQLVTPIGLHPVLPIYTYWSEPCIGDYGPEWSTMHLRGATLKERVEFILQMLQTIQPEPERPDEDYDCGCC